MPRWITTSDLPKFSGFLKVTKKTLLGLRTKLPVSRRFQVYCIGAAKTGTHSIANLFNQYYRTGHEPGLMDLVAVASQMQDAVLSRDEVSDFLHARDRRLRLEMEATHVLGFFAGHLARLFPKALFIVTVREPYGWLESVLNDQLRMMRSVGGERWMPIYELCFGQYASSPAPEERKLCGMGLYNLRSYTQYWRNHYQRVLREIPKSRRLILNTENLSGELLKIGRFLDLPKDRLEVDRAHHYAASRKESILSIVDQDFADEMIVNDCASVARELGIVLAHHQHIGGAE